MKFIEEVVVEEVLPTVRSMLAESLRERGLTQREVAAALGISQSAVSKYAHGEVDRNVRVLEDDRVRELVERVADGLATGEMTQIQALVEFEVLIRQLERGDLIAALHEAEMPALAGRTGGFSLHDPDSDLLTTERVLAAVRRGLSILENASGFAGLIPHVGSNVVQCLPDAARIEDVAGVPGRIFDVKGRPNVAADPEFGASAHVASVLLAARSAGSEARAALNIRYDPDLLASLEAQGLRSAQFDAEHEDLESAVAEALGSDPSVDVLYQKGGFGVEPIIYILASDAPTAAEHVRSLLHNG